MNILIVMALPQENVDNLIGQLGYPIVYTGVGKINATKHLTFYLAKLNKNELNNLKIINLGSAGSHTISFGEVVGINKIYQRDMDATALGCLPMQTPFEDDIFLTTSPIAALNQYNCYTGDSFVTQKGDWAVIDMEAYALANVAKQFGCPFFCAKFITDGADEDAHLDWPTRVKMAAQKLQPVVKMIADA